MALCSVRSGARSPGTMEAPAPSAASAWPWRSSAWGERSCELSTRLPSSSSARKLSGRKPGLSWPGWDTSNGEGRHGQDTTGLPWQVLSRRRCSAGQFVFLWREKSKYKPLLLQSKCRRKESVQFYSTQSTVEVHIAALSSRSVSLPSELTGLRRHHGQCETSWAQDVPRHWPGWGTVHDGARHPLVLPVLRCCQGWGQTLVQGVSQCWPGSPWGAVWTPQFMASLSYQRRALSGQGSLAASGGLLAIWPQRDRVSPKSCRASHSHHGCPWHCFWRV